MARMKKPPLDTAILSDGQTKGAGTPKPPGRPRTNLGGRTPPEKPKAKDTPRPSKQLAIGERPVLGKRMKKLGY